MMGWMGAGSLLLYLGIGLPDFWINPSQFFRALPFLLPLLAVSLIVTVVGFTSFLEIGIDSIRWGSKLKTYQVSSYQVVNWSTHGNPAHPSYKILLTNDKAVALYTANMKESTEVVEGIERVLKKSKFDPDLRFESNAKNARIALISLGVFSLVIGILFLFVVARQSIDPQGVNWILGGFVVACGIGCIVGAFLWSPPEYSFENKTLTVQHKTRKETYRIENLVSAKFIDNSESTDGNGHLHLQFPHKKLAVPSSAANFRDLYQAAEPYFPKPNLELIEQRRKAMEARRPYFQAFVYLLLIATLAAPFYQYKNYFQVGPNPLIVQAEVDDVDGYEVMFSYEVAGQPYAAVDAGDGQNFKLGMKVEAHVSRKHHEIAALKDSIAPWMVARIELALLLLGGGFVWLVRRLGRKQGEET